MSSRRVESRQATGVGLLPDRALGDAEILGGLPERQPVEAAAGGSFALTGAGTLVGHRGRKLPRLTYSSGFHGFETVTVTVSCGVRGCRERGSRSVCPESSAGSGPCSTARPRARPRKNTAPSTSTRPAQTRARRRLSPLRARARSRALSFVARAPPLRVRSRSRPARSAQRPHPGRAPCRARRRGTSAAPSARATSHPLLGAVVGGCQIGERVALAQSPAKLVRHRVDENGEVSRTRRFETLLRQAPPAVVPLMSRAGDAHVTAFTQRPSGHHRSPASPSTRSPSS